MRFEQSVLKAVGRRTESGSNGGSNNINDEQHSKTAPQVQWSFSRALLYSITVVTTIGYGTMSPSTTNGRLCTILYALFGVPLALICLSSVGTLLANGFTRLWSRLCCKYCLSEVDFDFQCEEDVMQSSWKTNKSMEGVTFDQYNIISERQRIMPQRYRQETQYMQCPQMQNDEYKMGMCSEDRIHSLQVCQTSYQSKCKKANPSEQLQRSNIKLATVRRGPRPPEITQLIAEHRIQHGISNANNIKCNVSKELMQSDEDDDDNNISSCSHDTPSRVPLICRSTIVTSHDANRTISNNIVNQSSRVTSSSLNSLVPLAVIALVLAFYIALGACIFSLWEDWSLLDGAYFCFVTLTTIGFGDILPLRSLNGNQLQLVACCGYLLVGLVLIAMAFSLVQSQIMLRCAISNERCFKH